MNDTGRPAAEVLAELEARQGQDPSIHGGRLFGLVYPTGRADLETVIERGQRRGSCSATPSIRSSSPSWRPSNAR